ncbi:multicopper oxidase domain-containing protein [Thioalkalivibrio versutus]|nr:multicopper oxidase domain-containing protein [Thioalkalivibrio versutus]
MSRNRDGGGMGGGGMGGGCDAGITGNCGLHIDAPNTPNRVTPDVEFFLNTFMQGSQVINGVEVPIWGFNMDGGGGMGGGGGGGMGGAMPSPPMRVRQGQIVHTHLNAMAMMAPHTVHHHGIEPDTFNDGVGHYSFDVLGEYTYQWRASQAGTYFYHCHTNTVLHAEMGMYGALIIDPPSGPGTVYEGGPSYTVEAIWAVDDIDMNWHCLPWDAALCGGDAGLDDFNPEIFCINGVGADLSQTDPSVVVNASRADRVLLRYIMAGYVPQRVRFPEELGPIQVVAEDGRPLPQIETIPAGGEILMTAAERYDLIFEPQQAGSFPVDIDFFDYRAADGMLKPIGSIRARFNIS